MAIENKRMQQRNGTYEGFISDTKNMLSNEFQSVESGDPNTDDGKALYFAFDADNIKRIMTSEDFDSISNKKGDTLKIVGDTLLLISNGEEISSVRILPSEGGGVGKDGREIELQNSGTAIQWRYVGDADWIDLVQLSDLKGDKGDAGEAVNGIPSGGVTGQVLAKKSNSDYDAEWKDTNFSGGSTALTQEQINTLYNLIKICAFTENPTTNIRAFETAWGIESDIPAEIWTVTNNLTNASNSNNATYVEKDSSYSAEITANEGYILDSVIVEMGGLDITSTSYSDGNINISSVTGNIVITVIAVQSHTEVGLPKDGLLDFFDFRNKEYKSGSGGLYYINSDSGDGMLYSWSSSQSGKVGDNIGLKELNCSYTTERATGYPVTINFPNVRTLCMFGKDGIFVPTDIGVDSNVPNNFNYSPKYTTTDKNVKNMQTQPVSYPEGFNKTGYNACFCVVNGNALKVYFDDKLNKTFNGSEIDDFASWNLSELKISSFTNYATAFAIYDRELSEIEIVETLEYFKTLEVNE